MRFTTSPAAGRHDSGFDARRSSRLVRKLNPITTAWIVRMKSRARNFPKIKLAAFAAAAAAFSFNIVHADAQIVWANTNNDGVWSEPGNWNPQVVPDDGDSALLPSGDEVVALDSYRTLDDLNIGSGATLEFFPVGNLDTSSLENQGAIYLEGSDTLTVTGDFSNSNIFQTTAGGNVINVDGTLTNTGSGASSEISLNYSGDLMNVAALNNQSRVYVATGATLNITEGSGVTDVPSTASYFINGTFNAGTTNAFANLSSVEGTANLANGQNYSIPGSIAVSATGFLGVSNSTTLSVAANLTNSGYFGTTTTGYPFGDSPFSIISVNGTLTNTSTGELAESNGGDIITASAITNSGYVVLEPGAFLGVGSGAFSSGAGFQQLSNGTWTEIVGGPAPIGNFMYVPGPAALNGTLNVTLAPGYVPSPTDSFTFLYADSITGAFNHGSPLVPIGRAFMGVNYATTNTPSVSVQPTYALAFFAELPGSAPLGHTFVELSQPNGTTDFFGFYPKYKLDPIFGPGTMAGDPNTPWNYSIAYPITQSVWQSVANFVNGVALNPPLYSVLDYNCTNFIQQVAQVANVQLPDSVDAAGFADPVAFAEALEDIGNGYTEDGGTVYFNPNAPKSTATHLLHSSIIAISAQNPQPVDCSYSGIEETGHTDPASLASVLGLPLDQIDLGTVNANTVTGLSLSLFGTNPSEDVISMNWGDGSAYDEQSLTFSHVYAPGTYTADLLDVDEGAVHSYDMTVDVSSAPSTPIEIDVTPYPTSDDPNPGLFPFTPISIPEPVSLSGVICGGIALLFPKRRRRERSWLVVSVRQSR
jgi:hypothetical protein